MGRPKTKKGRSPEEEARLERKREYGREYYRNRNEYQVQTEQERRKAYYQANRDRILEYGKRYREAHKAERAAYMKEYNRLYARKRKIRPIEEHYDDSVDFICPTCKTVVARQAACPALAFRHKYCHECGCMVIYADMEGKK